MDYTILILKIYAVVWFVIIMTLVIGTELVKPDTVIKRCMMISGVVSVLTLLSLITTMELM